jgi:cell division protein FtsQ
MASLPFEQATLHRIWTWMIVVAVGAVALSVATWFGVPGMAGRATAEAVGEAGFRLGNVELYGLKRMDRNTVYATALDQSSRAMPLLDLAKVRERLLQYPWIEDARVSRRLPNTMVINIIEREPAAIWQNNNRLILIDAKGALLEPVSREAMPALPVLIGEGANFQELARQKLMRSAPALKPLVKAATWVGNRRWDITFDTGQLLQLPEGEDQAAAALVKFAQLESEQRVLGGPLVRFDMRNDQLVACCKSSAQPTPAAADNDSSKGE